MILLEKLIASISEQNNWIYWVPIFLGVGILIYFSLPYEPSVLLGISIIPVILLIIVLIKKPEYKLLLNILIIISIGFSAAQIRTYFTDTKFIKRPTYFKNIQADVQEIIYAEKCTKLLLNNITHTKRNLQNIKVSVRTKMDDTINIGDTVQLSALLDRPSLPSASNSFNYSRFTFFRKISATGYATSEVRLLKIKEKHTVNNLIEIYRNYVRKNLDLYMNYPYNTILSALIVGKRDGIDPTILDNIRSSGLAHLLAISGLHLAIVAMSFYFFIRILLTFSSTLSLRFNNKKIAALLSILLSFIYLLIAGSPISAQRSFIMIALFFVAIIIDRNNASIRSVAIAAIIILIFQPESILGPSFQMSFAAVLSLISAHDFIKNNIPKGSLLFYIVDIIASSTVASLSTTPYAIYHFNYFSIGGVIANIVAIPLVSFIILPLGILATILMPFHINQPILYVIEIAINILLQTAEYTSNVFSTIKISNISNLVLLISTLSFLWLCFWKNNTRWFAIIGYISAIIIFINTDTPDILINQKHAAVKGPNNQIYFLKKTRKNFISNSWINIYGQESILTYKDYVNTANSFITCDNNNCIYKNNNHVIAFISNNNDLHKICDAADLIVQTSDKISNISCNKKLIKFEDLKNSGTHEVYLKKDKVITVKQSIGNRPWN